MNNELENQVLGCILLEPDLIKKLVVSEDCFFDRDNKFILNLMKKHYEEYKTISISGMVQNYKHLFNEKFSINEIVKKMTSLMNEMIIVGKFDYYQELLFSHFVNQKILDAIVDFQKEKIDKDDMLDQIHKYEMLSIKTKDESLSKEDIFKLINSKNKNIDFRLKTLSKYSNIQEHDLVVIAARPGIGKTGFILNLIEDLSSEYKCVLFNMEMSSKQVYQRLVGINTKVASKYHDKLATDYQRQAIMEGCENISKKKIKVITNTQSIDSLKKMIIKESQDGHTLFFIDYVGLISSREKNQTNYDRVTSIVKELRRISLDFNCTIFLAAQINRNSENQKDKRPKISDLKESGELEQSGTTVIMLHNDNPYQESQDGNVEIQAIIGKNRNGKKGIIRLNYNQENQRFDDIQKY